MSETIEWSSGLDGFKKHTLCNNYFTTELTECQFELGRDIDAIFFDHLLERQSKRVEILYSGGADSEFIVKSCIRNKIPFDIITMVIQKRGIVLNVTDLYYSEKFCRETQVKQNLIYLDVDSLFESGKYLDYLLPYTITEPHVASHFWLIEQCSHFPVFGGDWPWYQKNKKVLSPQKVAYSSYERFMKDKNIFGIGNMIGHSFESCFYFIEKQKSIDEKIISLLKQQMYKLDYPRLRSYGWEQAPAETFDISKYKFELLKKLNAPKSEIIWGEKISKLIESTVNRNQYFT